MIPHTPNPRPAGQGDPRDPRDPGVTDAELVRYLDGELDDVAVESLRARLAASPASANRLETLRRRAAGLSAILIDADPAETELAERAAAVRRALADRPDPYAVTQTAARPAQLPASRPGPRRLLFGNSPTAWPLKAAAMIALLLVAAFSVPPARAWVVDRVRDAAGALGLVADATRPEAGPAAAGAHMAVTFAVAGEAFEIHVPGDAGVVVLQAVTGVMGTAEAEGAPDAPAVATPRFVVLPDGLRIDGAAPGATYRISLPASVVTVRVRSGDGPTPEYRLPAAGETVRIDLPLPSMEP